MENPTENGWYTTIFKDGSIIHKNYWFHTNDTNGKWYWNESIRGGVIHWFKPEVEYELHAWYRLPDWELYELLEAQHLVNALDKADAYNYEIYNIAMRDYLNSINYETLQDAVKNDLNTYYAEYKTN